MNIREFSKPKTAKTLNESLAKKFGAKIDIDAFTTEQLMNVRNKLRTKVFNIETTESFNSVQTAEFQKNKLFLEVLNTALAERDDNISDALDEAVKQVNEGAEDTAQIVMASKDMVDRVTGWMEDTSEMETESMLELADAIRDEMGSEKSEAFVALVKQSLESLYTALETTRTALTQGVSMLTGEGDIAQPMGDPMDSEMDDPMGDPMDDSGLEDGIDSLDDEDFSAAGAAAGGDAPMGREKRESIDRNRSKKK